MREPYTGERGKNLRPRFTSYRFITTIRSLLDEYEASSQLSEKSSRIRARLISYQPIFQQIALKPVREALMSEVKRFKFLDSIKEPVEVGSLLSLEPTDIELQSFLNLPLLSPWLDLRINDEQNVRSLLSADILPGIKMRSVILRPDLSGEGVKAGASAGVEPITRTVLLRTSMANNVQVLRDSLSIVIDLIAQRQFLKEFYSTDGPLNMHWVNAVMLLSGLEVSVAAYEFILGQAKYVKAERYSDALVLRATADYYESAHYLRYIVGQLILGPIDHILKTASSQGMTELRDILVTQYKQFYTLRRCRILVQSGI